LFLSYFPNNTIEILEGGIESGFHHVEAKQYKPRLLQVKGTRVAVRVNQVPLSASSLNSGDAFILDLGLTIYQWNGSKSSSYEKVKAGQVVRAMKDERGGKPVCQLHSEGDSDLAAEFWTTLGGKKPIAPADSNDEAAAKEALTERKLYRLSDSSGKLSFTLVKSGNLDKKDLDTNDVFVIDTGAEVFVWIGKKSSQQERKNGLQSAQQYLTDNNRPSYLPISRVMESGENQVFEALFSPVVQCRGIDEGPGQNEGYPHACCPHFPGGANTKYAFVQQQSQSASRLSGTKGVAKGSDADVEKAVQEVFGFFANKVSHHQFK